MTHLNIEALPKYSEREPAYIEELRKTNGRVRYNVSRNTYNEVPIVWDNIQQFQIFFLEGQYLNTEAEYLLRKLSERRKSLTKNEYQKELYKIVRERDRARMQLEETYKINWKLRKQIEMLYNGSEEFKESVDKRSKDDFVFWINSFAWTYDPRLTNIGLAAKVPLILFPGQVDVLNKVERCFRGNRDFLVEKSRAEGLTEILCAFDVHHWLYVNGFKAGWGSRVAKLVDQKNNPDTIFERIRRIYYNLPEKMLLDGLKSRGSNYDSIMRFVNPINGNTIIGEGGDNIGRGGRSSFYTVDEKAAIEHPEAVDASLSYNTNCQGDISTVNGMDHFYHKRMSGKTEVITVWWWRNPSKNFQWAKDKVPEYSAWYQNEKETRDEVLLAKEVDIKYEASVEGSFIPAEWVEAAVDFEIEASGERVGGFDIAAGGEDKSVYISRVGSVVSKPKESPMKTPLEATWNAVDWGVEDNIQLLNYDKNSFGEDVAPLLELSDRDIPFKINGIYGQGKASEEYVESEGRFGNEIFRNKRAENWWTLRKRFEKTFLHKTGVKFFSANEMISIPRVERLIMELSSPRLVHTVSGKIGVESKLEMKKRNVKSPNDADALTYCFANSESNITIKNVNYNSKEVVAKVVMDKTRPLDLFVSIFEDKDTNIYVLVIFWDLITRTLNIYKEYKFPLGSHKELKETIITEVGSNRINPIKYWIGNEEIFNGIEKGKLTEWYEYRKVGIPIKKNYRFNEAGMMSTLFNLFRGKQLILNEECSGTISQIKNWRMNKNTPVKNLPYIKALGQVAQMLIKENIISSHNN